MAGDTLTTVSGILKDIYLEPMRTHFNTKKVLLAKMKRGPMEDVEGNNFYISIAHQRAHGYGARADDGTLPGAGNASYQQMSPSWKRNYAVIQITGPAIRAAKTNRGSFMRTLNASAVAAEEGLLRSVTRQMHGDGSGILATCATTTASTTVNVDSTKYLEVGQVVDIRTKSTGTAVSNGDSVTISAVDATNNTITISGSGVTTTTSEAVYMEDSRNLEMMGLEGIVYNGDPGDIKTSGVGSLQGLAVATYDWWKASYLENSGVNRAISIDLLSDLFVDIENNSGKSDELNMILSKPAIWAEYGKLLVPDRRYGGSQKDLDGGFRYLEFDGVKWFFDRDTVDNTVYVLNTDSMAIYENAPLTWADDDGQILRHVANKDAWTAYLLWYAELAVRLRFCNGVLKDISE